MLTHEQKKVLGIMTDEGVIRGTLREQIASDDALAITKIAEFKESRAEYIINEKIIINSEIEQLNARLAKVLELEEALAGI